MHSRGSILFCTERLKEGKKENLDSTGITMRMWILEASIPQRVEVQHLLQRDHGPSDSGHLLPNEDVSIYALRLIHLVQSSPSGLPRGLVCLFYTRFLEYC